MAKAKGTAADPWVLKTPPGTSAFTVHRDTVDGTDMLVCTVGKTVLHYEYRRLKDLHDMLKAQGLDGARLGRRAEASQAGTVEAWGRSPKNPIGGWYGRKKGLRGRFGMYIPPLVEELELAEVEHNARGNRMRAR